MRLERALVGYGLLAPMSILLADQFAEIVRAHGAPCGMATRAWIESSVFDDLWATFEPLGECSRTAVDGGLYHTPHRGVFLPDLLMYIREVQLGVGALPTHHHNRPFLYADGDEVVARLRFDVPDPLAGLMAELDAWWRAET